MSSFNGNNSYQRSEENKEGDGKPLTDEDTRGTVGIINANTY